jgi:hypothetical protein
MSIDDLVQCVNHLLVVLYLLTVRFGTLAESTSVSGMAALHGLPARPYELTVVAGLYSV